MKYYVEQIKHYQAKHLAARDVGDDKLADECQFEIDNYTELNNQVKG